MSFGFRAQLASAACLLTLLSSSPVFAGSGCPDFLSGWKQGHYFLWEGVGLKLSRSFRQKRLHEARVNLQTRYSFTVSTGDPTGMTFRRLKQIAHAITEVYAEYARLDGRRPSLEAMERWLAESVGQNAYSEFEEFAHALLHTMKRPRIFSTETYLTQMGIFGSEEDLGFLSSFFQTPILLVHADRPQETLSLSADWLIHFLSTAPSQGDRLQDEFQLTEYDEYILYPILKIRSQIRSLALYPILKRLEKGKNPGLTPEQWAAVETIDPQFRFTKEVQNLPPKPPRTPLWRKIIDGN